jgi:pilin isopeptide linkage protein/LPXTG-motif cell wall-anchored protein
MTVSDNGNGTLKVETSDNAKALTFINTYTAKGEITFSGIKSIDGRKLTANDKFEFTLYDDEGKEIEKAYNDEAGYYQFHTIEYDLTKVGEHVYTVKETSKDGSGITVDTTEYKITVMVTDGGKGELNVTAVTDKEGVDTSHLNFTNKYEATGSVQLEANKSLLGRILREAEFEFELYKDGQLISKANNANDGKIVFDRIDYDLSDAGKSYEYTVKEVPGNVPGVTYDEREFKITVTITDNGDGTLNAEVTTDKKVEFVNPYNAEGKLVLEGKKTLKGGKLAGNDFEFTLSENGEVIQTVKNDAKGNISFEEICYTLDDVGTHTYTVKEKAGKKSGMTYDQTEYTIKVEVTDNGDGTLKVEADKTCKALNFTNVYEPPTTPKTGDSTNVMLHAFMLTSSLLALLFLLRKKKTNE